MSHYSRVKSRINGHPVLGVRREVRSGRPIFLLFSIFTLQMKEINEYSEETPIKESNSDGTFEHYRFVADPGQGPMRLDKFLFDRMEKVSRNRIQNAVKDGSIKVNGNIFKSNYKIRPNDVITIELPEPPYEPKALIPENIPLDIRYEDDYLMVVHKPAGMVVHPGVGVRSGTLVHALAYYFQNMELPIKEGNYMDRPGLVHRIDKNTSGLLVAAKTPEAMTHLSKQFFDHTSERKYIALVWGEPADHEGTININVGRHPTNRTKHFAFKDGEEGKHAITHYKVIEPMYYVSLVECVLETGRTHQIRVHMNSVGHPIFNDDRYGGDKIMKGTIYTKYKRFVENCFDVIPRQALHAKSLGFTHPETGERMLFESDLPDDFEQVLVRWRNYIATRKS